MREDASCLAAEMEGEVEPYDDKELTVYGPDGDEIARFEALFESSEIHPELTCDRCGFTSRQEDYFDIVGDEILCDRCRRGMNESSDLDDYEIGQKMQDFADETIPEVRSVVTGSSPGMIYVVLNPDVYIMADEAKEMARELIRASGARGYRYVGLNKADPYIIIARR